MSKEEQACERRFLIEPLDPAKHERAAFTCGVGVLDDYLRTRARKEMDAGTSACFVMVPRENTSQIAGYYTLSAATIIRTELPEDLQKKLPRYREMPATLLGRLARSLDFKGQGIGERLLVSALIRSVAASREVASCAIITDPKDEKARSFYEGFGFRPLTARRLFLPMKEAADWLNAR
jgi:predicted N-acetyltransferase YhbS